MPEAERQLVGHRRAVIDGHVEHAAACCRVVLDVVHAHAAACVIEGTYYVARVGDEVVVHKDLCHDVHRVALHLRCYRPVGCCTLYGQFQVVGIRHAVLIDEVDHLVIRAHLQVGTDGEVNLVGCLRLHDVARLIDGNPAWHVLDSVGVSLAAVVLDDADKGQRHTMRYGHHAVLAQRHPRQRVAVDVEALRGRRSHEVAILVGNVVERHIDVLLVDAAVLLVDVHQQLVVTTHVAEFQVAQLLVGLHGCADVAVDETEDFVD